MASDDIRDLLGRYAMGPLTSEERERLFDAAMSDQSLFEELAREQELKLLLQEPGARDRMMRALDAPKRRATWILLAAAVAAALVVAIFLVRSSSPPTQMAKVIAPPVPTELVTPEARPAPTPVRVRAKTMEKPVLDQPAGAPAKQEVANARTESPVPAPAAPRAQQFAPQQQNAIGGQQQMASQARVAGASALADQKAAFGFNYSLDTEGHLVIVPASDGYLFVKSNDGAILFERKQIAAAIKADIPLAALVKVITITFSSDSDPVDAAPTPRAANSGTIEGASPLAIELKVPHK